MARLAGKVALITGSARGMGAETAREFVREGARVVVSDLLDEQGSELAAEFGRDAVYMHLDVRDEENWRSVIADAEDAFGRLDILVNNAAVLHVAPIESHGVAEFERVMMVNEIGCFLGIRAVIDPMVRAGGGAIVNVSSLDGLVGAPGSVSYVASKFALGGLTRTAAAELGPLGIRVNGMLPSAGNPALWSEFMPPGLDPEVYISMVPPPPIGRRGTLSDCARAITFLASDDSAFINGIDLVVDGGYTAGPSAVVIGGPSNARE